jgi:lipoate synthase
LPVTRYWEPGEFDALADAARALGFPQIASGPLVRSSFNAAVNFSELRDATHDSVADALGGE